MLFKVMKLLAILFSFLITSSYASEYEKVGVNVIAENISGSSYYVPGKSGAATEFEGFISNSGFVITKDGVVVFDALGSPSLGRALLEEIRKLTDKPIKLVIVSHYHADHIYGLQVFKEEGAEIWAPKGAWDYIGSEVSVNLLESRRESLFPWVNEETYIVKPDRIIDSDTNFSLGEHEFLINYFGQVHSDGDMSLLDLNDEVLYSGDIIFEGRIPFVGDADLIQWSNTIDRLRNMNVMYFVPGHGKASNNPKKTMDLTYRYLNYLLDKFALVVEDMQEFDEAYDSIDWSEFEKNNAFEIANRRNAFAAYLYLENILE
jgi:glyoxylase-like metal-dependent hydrolase (beta-lactamase superfamily II)